MPTKEDNDTERFARTEAPIRQYHIRHEDLARYVQEIQQSARVRHAASQAMVRKARKQFERTNRRMSNARRGGKCASRTRWP